MIFIHRGFRPAALLLATTLLTAGCGSATTTDKDKKVDAGKDKKDKVGEEGHAEKGPNGGPLAEWGEEKYHAEFTADRAKKQATVYILDGTAKKADPIKAETITLTLTSVKPPVQVTLKAAPQESDPKGSASRFVGTHDALGDAGPFKGEIGGKVGDTPYAGTFEEKK